MEINTIPHSYKTILSQWQIMNNNRCSFCGNEEDYLHYFITCSFLKTFWEKIYNLFKSNNLEFTLKLKHLIFGYKISDNNYYGVKLVNFITCGCESSAPFLQFTKPYW
jgi:hypothetical protein